MQRQSCTGQFPIGTQLRLMDCRPFKHFCAGCTGQLPFKYHNWIDANLGLFLSAGSMEMRRLMLTIKHRYLDPVKHRDDRHNPFWSISAFKMVVNALN